MTKSLRFKSVRCVLTLIALVALAGALTGDARAASVGAGDLAGGPSEATTLDDLQGDHWDLGSPTDRWTVTYDPAKGPWVKKLDDHGFGILTDDWDDNTYPMTYTTTFTLNGAALAAKRISECVYRTNPKCCWRSVWLRQGQALARD